MLFIGRKFFILKVGKLPLLEFDHFLGKKTLSYDVRGDMFKSFTIPSLSPTLDKSLKEVRTMCPIRALRYYLDRTYREGLTKSRSAFFVPLRETGGELSKLLSQIG